MSVPGMGLLGTHVLIVDDDTDNREMLAMTLEHCGARVTTAGSAAEALRALEEGRPHVLVSDIGLPGEDGYSLLRQVRALPATRGGTIPAIALSGRASWQLGGRSEGGDFAVHLTKPVTPEHLLDAIARVLGETKGEIDAQKTPTAPTP